MVFAIYVTPFSFISPRSIGTNACQKLDTLVANLKPGKRYDLLIPFSGGKDSTYQLYFMRQRYPHLKILAVTFDHLFFRKAIIDNNTRTLQSLVLIV